MSTPDGRKVAVVLSGGGANGAYEVGVLKALLSGKSPTTGGVPLEPDIVCGTSIGGFNAMYLVSQWGQFGAAGVANLERFWLDRMAGGFRTNGVFRLRGNPLGLLDPTSYLPQPLRPFTQLLADGGFLGWQVLQRAVDFATSAPLRSPERALLDVVDVSSFISMEPFERNLAELDYEAVRRSRLVLKVAAVNWGTGRLRVFYNRDFTDDFGPIAVRASAALPGLFPPVAFGSQPLVDGSVLLNTPLSLAIHAGADEVHVVYLDPEISNIPLGRMGQTLNSVFRLFQIGWAAAYNDDIGDAARINRSLAALERLRGRLQLDAESADLLEEVAQVRPRPGRPPLKPLTIYRYHPKDPLAGDTSFFNFDRDRVGLLIERGFQDTAHHDSVASLDVFPDGRLPDVPPEEALPWRL
jgi:predicted acylesterase/phospholipase RssA